MNSGNVLSAENDELVVAPFNRIIWFCWNQEFIIEMSKSYTTATRWILQLQSGHICSYIAIHGVQCSYMYGPPQKVSLPPKPIYMHILFMRMTKHKRFECYVCVCVCPVVHGGRIKFNHLNKNKNATEEQGIHIWHTPRIRLSFESSQS